jgi:hypothetical protein
MEKNMIVFCALSQVRTKTTNAARRRASKSINDLLVADRDRLAAISQTAQDAILASYAFQQELASLTANELAFRSAVERATMGMEYCL